MTFQDFLTQVFVRRSEGLDKCGKSYMELCMSLHLCRMHSASARRQFAALLAKKHTKNYAMTVMARARRLHGEARQLKDQAVRESAV